MRTFTVAFLAVLFFQLSGSGQSTQVLERLQEQERRRNEASLERRMKDMQVLSQNITTDPKRPRELPLEPKLSDEARDRVIRLRRIDVADLRRYQSLLAQPGTGIFKIFPDLGCLSKNLVSVGADCERAVLLSSAFTFRSNGYSDEIYHDIYFKSGKISSNSFFSQGIFGVVGDEPIEKIDLTHPALRFLTAFRPATDPKTALDNAKEFQTGLESNGFQYADSITPGVNSTYVMRVVAYRLENSLGRLTDETPMNELMFHSLAFDKRVDLIVAFRILSRDEYGGYTIVWKEIDRHDAEKIKFKKSQPLRDFRPARIS